MEVRVFSYLPVTQGWLEFANSLPDYMGGREGHFMEKQMTFWKDTGKWALRRVDGRNDHLWQCLGVVLILCVLVGKSCFRGGD